jgi:hypothetical protein
LINGVIENSCNKSPQQMRQNSPKSRSASENSEITGWAPARAS